MAKGEGVAPPMCRNCGEAHWKEPGKVCPKFRSPKRIPQPVPLRLAPPPAPAGTKVSKKAKKAKKKPQAVKKPKETAAGGQTETT